MFQHLKFALRREATRDFEPVCRKVPDNYQPGSESQVWLTKTRPDKWRCRLKLQAMTGTCAVHEGGRDWSKKYLNALAKTHNIRGKNYWPQVQKKKRKRGFEFSKLDTDWLCKQTNQRDAAHTVWSWIFVKDVRKRREGKGEGRG